MRPNDDAFERGPLASQSLRTTARTRLWEERVVIEVMYKNIYSAAEIAERLRMIATDAMVQLECAHMRISTYCYPGHGHGVSNE